MCRKRNLNNKVANAIEKKSISQNTDGNDSGKIQFTSFNMNDIIIN